MKKLIKIALMAALTISSINVKAELINTDWKEISDNKAVLESTSGTEWLRLTLTRNYSLSSISELLSTEYQGWRIAKTSDIKSLYENVFTNQSFDNYTSFNVSDSETIGQIADFKNKFGMTAESHTYGLYASEDGGATYLGGISHTARIEFEVIRAYNLDYVSSRYGVFLINDGGVTLSSINDPSLNINNPSAPVNDVEASVPVPASLTLLGLAMVGFGVRRKSKS